MPFCSELGLELVQAALEELLAGVLRRRDHRHVRRVPHQQRLDQVRLGAELAVHLAHAFRVGGQLEAEGDGDHPDVRVGEAGDDGLVSLECRRDDLLVVRHRGEEGHYVVNAWLCVHVKLAGQIVLDDVRNSGVRHQHRPLGQVESGGADDSRGDERGRRRRNVGDVWDAAAKGG